MSAPLWGVWLGTLVLLATLLLPWGPDHLGAFARTFLLTGLFSKLEPPTLLRCPTRQVLHDRIRKTPGLAFLQLRNQSPPGKGGCRIGVGNLQYHLRRLEDAGLIVSRRVGLHRRYYEASVGRQVRVIDQAWLAAGPRALVTRLVIENPGIGLGQLGRDLGLSRPLLWYHVRRLVERGLMEVRLGGRQRACWPTSKLSEALALGGRFPVHAGSRAHECRTSVLEDGSRNNPRARLVHLPTTGPGDTPSRPARPWTPPIHPLPGPARLVEATA